jgi:hypothetical protein
MNCQSVSSFNADPIGGSGKALDPAHPQCDLKISIGSHPVAYIEQLEIRIEELREAIQRSRRFMMAGRTCAIIGPALLSCFVLGLLEFTPVRMVVGIALAIGGVVLMGSSRSSTEQLELALKRTEGERSAAIDALKLVQLGDRAKPTGD